MREALVKSWKMAKLAILESELFLFNMKDLSGGRNNVVAQMQIIANNSKIDELNRKVNALKSEIYPTVKEERRVRNKMFGQASSTVRMTFCEETKKYIEEKIEVPEYRTIASEYLDVHAYDAA
jgi:outer membrane murein-binding lipoprotein Lpp